MWIFSKFGFFSIVQDFQAPDILHVRARVAGDLERAFSACGIRALVTVNPDADYRYRSQVSRDDFLKLLAYLGENLNYPNFKSEIAKDPTQLDRLPAYHEVWHTLQAIQK
jgi:hypothetical protein